ncbi:MAG: methylated-DNA--[protein]-cysteine S-methyltransferase [Ruminococcus sp.]|nr:methylated-DNA--[protein]-cysteine S-methyltransferase [Ruminococcus sp.]
MRRTTQTDGIYSERYCIFCNRGKYKALGLDSEHEEKETAVLKEAKRWLDIYFSGRKPDFTPPVHMVGTEFQNEVWEILLRIPYGQTATYGEIAKELAEKHGIPKMSAQAVGGAVGRNKLSIIIPCHRVVGTNGSLTGYAGGIDKKIMLLELEGVDLKNLYIPKKAQSCKHFPKNKSKNAVYFV